jgi:hypothetical protein
MGNYLGNCLGSGLVGPGIRMVIFYRRKTPAVRKTLRVEAKHFVAGAVWTLTEKGWVCELAAPILKWMKGMSPMLAYEKAVRCGYRCEWLEDWVEVSEEDVV